MGILANILIFNVNRNYNIFSPVILLDLPRTGYVRDYVFSSDIRAFFVTDRWNNYRCPFSFGDKGLVVINVLL